MSIVSASIGFKEKLSVINDLVEPVINELLSQNTETKNVEVALYQCKSGGKRIRPALVVLSGQLFGANSDDLLYPAASIEILHNATLIIDDIIDHSEFRRDEPTCWNEYGQSIAECASFMYISSVFAGLVNVNNGPRLVDLYSKTLKTIIDGEIKDILFERSGRDNEKFVVRNRYSVITKDDYLEMIGQKTAVLLKTCCQAGAIIANATEEQVDIVGDFGYKLGMAFQIRDDTLDIFGDEKEFGKKIGKDIIEKKMGNYVILCAINEMDDDGRQRVISLFEGEAEITDDDVRYVTEMIQNTNAVVDAEALADSFINDAFESLAKLPNNEHGETLAEIAKYIVDRKK